MSVVVYCRGVLAADSKAYGGKYQTSPGAKRKAHRLSDGTRVGVVSSTIGMPERFVAWLDAGADPKEWGEGSPDVRAIIVRPNGDVFLADEGLHFSGPIDCEFYAIGSGSDYAMGALAMGANANRAVEIAAQFDPHCGAPVTILQPE